MKLKQQIDQLGEQARKLREELQGAADAVSVARDELKGYDAERKKKTAKLREVLSPIVKHLQSGGYANGVKGLHNWAWWYNPTTKSPKNSARQIMRVVNGTKKDEGDMKSPKTTLNLDKNPTHVILKGVKYAVNKTPFHHGGVIHISVTDLTGAKSAKKEDKPTHTVHIIDLRQHHKEKYAAMGHGLCGVDLTRVHHKQRKNETPNCTRCLAIAPTVENKLIEVITVKKLSASDSEFAIDRALSEIKGECDKYGVPTRSRAEMLADFKVAVAAHPEWLASRVNKAMRKLRIDKYHEEQALKNQVRVKLTDPQRREVHQAGMPDSAVIAGSNLVLYTTDYQEAAKALVLALEKRSADLRTKHDTWRGNQNMAMLSKLLDWTNQSPEGKAAKQVVTDYTGAVKACDGAIWAIIHGDLSDDPTRNILDWYDGEHAKEVERQAEEKYQQRIAELDAKRDATEMHPAAQELEKALGAAVEVVECPTEEAL